MPGGRRGIPAGVPQGGGRLGGNDGSPGARQAGLVRHGVPREAVSVQGYGESRALAPPVAQGVREPQNRRVEIVLRRGPQPIS